MGRSDSGNKADEIPVTQGAIKLPADRKSWAIRGANVTLLFRYQIAD